MAFEGYLVKLKGVGNGADEELPMKYFALDSYSCTPDQRMESKANRATTGLLHRTTVEHTSTKIEFETPSMTNTDLALLSAMFARHFTDARQRRITIVYYHNETDTYKEADCYMPDVQYKIQRVDLNHNTVVYNKIRYAFIEY